MKRMALIAVLLLILALRIRRAGGYAAQRFLYNQSDYGPMR